MLRNGFNALIIFGLINCQNGSNTSDSVTEDQQHSNSSKIFADSVTQFEVKVLYEAGAEPYTGAVGLTGNQAGNQVWDITKTSYQSLFQNHSARSVVVPDGLPSMVAIPDQNKVSWSSGELIQLGRSMAVDLAEATAVRLTVIFVNGKLDNNANILGVHFSGYHFAFVFKDVVVSAGGDPSSQRYVEQATVVHELGHVIGLINNGVPLATNHEDSNHQKHTTDNNCVMYWQVESKSEILSFLSSIILANDLDLFGAQSLEDGRAFHQ